MLYNITQLANTKIGALTLANELEMVFGQHKQQPASETDAKVEVKAKDTD